MPIMIHKPRPTHRINVRSPRGARTEGAIATSDPVHLQPRVRDASGYPHGWTVGVAYPQTEADVAALVQQHRTILPIGAQSSVTGGATPFGALVLSTANMSGIQQVDHGRVRVQAGVLLGTLQAALDRDGRYYPPVPSYTGPSVGGVLATNAAGPATFKYGSTRDWVDALTVVLATGEVLDVERGQCVAHEGYFEIDGPSGIRRVPVPTYHMPDVAKRSAGYYAAPEMDLVDLFVGAEGTLGIITAATLRVVAPAPRVCVASIACSSDAQALALTAHLRNGSIETRRTHNHHGLDVSAIEYLDRQSLDLLHEHRSQHNLVGVLHADPLLLVQVELPLLAVDAPLAQLRRLLADAGVLDHTEIVPPDDHNRAEQVLAVRAAVPQEVNARIARAQRQHSPQITKVGADMIVPFEHTGAMIALFRDRFEQLGIPYAIWGHVSDGNLHPNALPRSAAEAQAAQAVVLEIGNIVTTELGGCPLAEHGVGRNPIKQALLRQLYGDAGIQQMRAVKQALDPQWKLAPGNVFPAPHPKP